MTGEYLALNKAVYRDLVAKFGCADAGLVAAIAADTGPSGRCQMSPDTYGPDRTVRRQLARLEAAGVILWRRARGTGVGWLEVLVGVDARPRESGTNPARSAGNVRESGTNPARIRPDRPDSSGETGPRQETRDIDSSLATGTTGAADQVCDSCGRGDVPRGKYRHPTCPAPIHSVPPRPRDWTQRRYDDPEPRPPTAAERKAADIALAAQYAAG